MNINHILWKMIIGVLLYMMLSCLAIAEEEPVDGGLAVGIYVVNSKGIFNDFEGTIPFIEDTAVAATALSSEMEQVSLIIAKPRKDAVGETVVFEENALTSESFAAMVDAVADIQGISMSQNNIDYRVDGLSELACTLEKKDADRKLLIVFTALNEWNDGYTKAVRDFHGDVLLIRLSSQDSNLDIPEDLSHMTIMAVDGYDGSVLSQVIGMVGADEVSGNAVRIFTEMEAANDVVMLEVPSEMVVRRNVLLIGQVSKEVEFADYQSDGLCFMHYEAGESAFSVELLADMTAFVVDELDQYRITSFNESDDEGNLTMAKNVATRIESEIERVGESNAAMIADWQVSLLIENAAGQSTEYMMSFDPATGHYVRDIVQNKSGSYTYYFKATNAFGMEITSDVGEIVVQNAKPVVEGDLIVLEKWQHSPVELDSSIDLYEYFKDDDPDSLTFRIEPTQADIGIQNSHLDIIAGDETDVSFSGIVIAEDEEGETAQIPFQAIALDVKEAMASGTLTILPDTAEVYKGDMLKVSAEYRFSESGQKYIDLLRASNLQDELLSLIQAGFVLKKDDALVEAQTASQIQWNEEGQLDFSATIEFPAQSGQYALEGWIGQTDGEDELFQQISYVLAEVVNRPPQILKESFEFALLLSDVFGGDMRELNLCETMRLDDYIAGEADERLTITLLDTSLLLYQDDDRTYRLTDQVFKDQKTVEAIIWDIGSDAPMLNIVLTKVAKQVVLTLSVHDDDGIAAEKVIVLSGSVRTVHQDLFVFLAIITAALIAGTALFLIVRQLLKPSLKHMTLELKLNNGLEYFLPLDGWKKKRLTIWDAILCTGLPLVCDINYEELEKVLLSAAHKQQYAIYRLKESAVILLTEKDTLLNGKKVGIGLGEYVTLAIDHVNILRIRILKRSA